MPPAEIEIIPGVIGPATFVADNWIIGTGHPVRMTITFDPEARTYVCDEICVRRSDGEEAQVGPITTEVLRDVPVALGIKMQLLIKASDGHHLRDLPNPEGCEPWGRKLPEGLRAEGPTDRVLRWVAHWYRLAIVLGNAPTKAVQEGFGVPRTTAVRWVIAAREKGYLGLAEVGKSGEVQG